MASHEATALILDVHDPSKCDDWDNSPDCCAKSYDSWCSDFYDDVMTTRSCGGGKFYFECICKSDNYLCNDDVFSTSWSTSTTIDLSPDDWDASWDEDYYEDWDDAANAAAGAVATAIILSIVGPIVGCIICCVVCCWCNKTCCFEKKMDPIFIGPPQEAKQ